MLILAKILRREARQQKNAYRDNKHGNSSNGGSKNTRKRPAAEELKDAEGKAVVAISTTRRSKPKRSKGASNSSTVTAVTADATVIAHPTEL